MSIYNIENYEYDCTQQCSNREHGHKITSALTKKAVSDETIAAYIAKICRNFVEVKDFEGRSALHVAASVGRYKIVEWLLNQGAMTNTKDAESGSSALHRSLFYGCIDCAVLLLRYGACVDLTDKDYMNPLQYICKPGELDNFCKLSQNNEALVWGSNKNYNLGLDKNEGSSIPQRITTFGRGEISVQSMAIGIYHSLFIDTDGNIYAVGHGEGGRLGVDSENSLTAPMRLKLPTKDPEEKAMRVSVSRNHSLILTNKGTVFACGMNTDHQLGLNPPPEKSTVPKKVNLRVELLKNVIAKDYHSLAYTNKDIWVWGANKGQFGNIREKSHLELPQQLLIPENKIVQIVESSNTAVVCYTACKLLFIFHGYKINTIKSPGLEPLACLSITDGCAGKIKGDCDTLRILILTIAKCVYIWHEDSMQYVRCAYLQTRLLHADKILLNGNRLLILANGDVYTAKMTRRAINNTADITDYKDIYSKKQICSKTRISIDLKRKPQVDRVIDIFSDGTFESFAVIQEGTKKFFTVPAFSQANDNNYQLLLNEVDETDFVHDIVLHVCNKVYPAHKFIIYSRSKGMMKVLETIEGKHAYLNNDGMSSKMFELILKHIYMNYSPSRQDLDEIHHSLGISFLGNLDDATNIFLNFVEKFELRDLISATKSLIDGSSQPTSKFPNLNRTAFPNLHDLKIICAGKKEINAHKCILVARMEYFKMMFSNSWSETKIVNLSTFSIEYILPLVDFAYTNNAGIFKKEICSDGFLYNMIVICDQFFFDRLRNVCEELILERVSTRKCGEMLSFAHSYNCEILENGTLEFICQNLARILEMRSLDICEPDVLHKINIHYRRKYCHKLDYRIITPSSDAVSDVELNKFITNFKVDLEYKFRPANSRANVKTKSKPSKTEISKKSYEMQAIQSMKYFDADDGEANKTKHSPKNNEIENVPPSQVHHVNTKWTKVVEHKKETKNKWVYVAVKANEAAKSNTTFEETLKNSSLDTIDKSEFKVEKIGFPSDVKGVTLEAFMPIRRIKASQIRREMLESNLRAELIINSPSKFNDNDKRVSNDCSSFAEVIKSPAGITNVRVSPEKLPLLSAKSITPGKNDACTEKKVISHLRSSNHEDDSFLKIILQESEQKEYSDKLKSKPLTLTQIEESAIAELNTFYNADSVYDELIQIERKCREQRIQLAVWHQNIYCHPK